MGKILNNPICPNCSEEIYVKGVSIEDINYCSNCGYPTREDVEPVYHAE